MPQSPIEWFDVRSRNKRDLDSNLISEDAVTYTICVRLVERYFNLLFTSTHERDELGGGKKYIKSVSRVCSHSLKRNLTGMGIADVTLLSGFEVVIEDLDKVGGSFYLLYISQFPFFLLR